MSILSSHNPWLAVAIILAGGASTFATSGLARLRPPALAALGRELFQPWQGRPTRPLLSPVETDLLAGVPNDAQLMAAAEAIGLPPSAAPQSPPANGAMDRTQAPAQVATPSATDSGTTSSLGAPKPHPSAFLKDPTNELRHFRAALARARQGRGSVRIAHFGDSVVTGDLITGEARSLLHRMVGDSGHGWILPGRPWEFYSHVGVTPEGKGWRVNAPELSWRNDSRYGLAGVSFSGAAAESHIHVAKNVAFSHVEVHFLTGPRGGTLLVSVDRNEPVPVSTRSDDIRVRVQRIAVGEGHREITLRTKGDGEVTLYGLVLEREAAGAVYDALGSSGATVALLAKGDAANWVQSLKARRPDLIVLAFGTNEASFWSRVGASYAQPYRELVRRIREALPDTSILIMSPMDRGERGASSSMPNLMRIVDAQQQIARETNCAFFDTFRAMGGAGAAARWYRANPRLMTGDLTHPTRIGADRVARLLVAAVTAAGYQQSAAAPVASVGPAAPAGPSPQPMATPVASQQPVTAPAASEPAKALTPAPVAERPVAPVTPAAAARPRRVRPSAPGKGRSEEVASPSTTAAASPPAPDPSATPATSSEPGTPAAAGHEAASAPSASPDPAVAPTAPRESAPSPAEAKARDAGRD